MRKGVGILLAAVMCFFLATGCADGVVLEKGSVTVQVEGLTPGGQYSVTAVGGEKWSGTLTGAQILYANQFTADDSGILSVTFLHTDLPECVFLVGGALAESDSPRMAGRYSPAEGESWSAGLMEIGEEAFAGAGFEQVVLGEQVQRIGRRAFADCAELRSVIIPAGVTEIAGDAFEGCGMLTILCEKDSAACSFAREHGYTVVIR